METEATDYRCVLCGYGIKTLYVHYSPGNIRLMKCKRCRMAADEYIECELMILLIDLILHKTKAYRHLLYIIMFQPKVDAQGLLWKSALCFLSLDAYRSILLGAAQDGCGSSMCFSSFIWMCEKILLDVLVGNLILFSILLVVTRSYLSTRVNMYRCKDLVLAILISSSWKIFLLAMMIWEFPSSVVFIIDGFVLSSNVVALKVITESNTQRCIWACFASHAARIFFQQQIYMSAFAFNPDASDVIFYLRRRPRN